jgi:hypothetical protein
VDDGHRASLGGDARDPRPGAARVTSWMTGTAQRWAALRAIYGEALAA